MELLDGFPDSAIVRFDVSEPDLHFTDRAKVLSATGDYSECILWLTPEVFPEEEMFWLFPWTLLTGEGGKIKSSY